MEGSVDIVLGVSMAPSTVRMVLVEGENADGASLDHDAFEIVVGDSPATSGAPQQVLDAILGTQESAGEGGHRLTSVGVAWTDHADAARLRQSLRQHRLHDVVMVSELHAASALAQAIGHTVGCERTALLFVERDTATLAVVRTDDGAVVRVLSRGLEPVDSVTELQAMVTGLDAGDEPAQAVFVVGSGVDVADLQPHIATATSLPVHAPDDGDLALARGAALAAVATPRYEATTVGLGSIEDTAAGATQLAAAGYMAPLGYSAVPDDDDLLAYDGPAIDADAAPEEPSRKPFVLVGSAVSTIFVIGVAALVITLAVVIRPTADQRPEPGGNPVVSSIPAPVPAQAKDAAPLPAPETIQAPIPVVQEAPRTVVVAPSAPAPAAAPAPAPAAAPAPVAPPPAPAPEAAPAPPAPVAPAAPAPAVAPAPVAPPVVVPVPIVLPPIFQAPSLPITVPRTPRTPSPANPAPATSPSTPATSAPGTSAPATSAPATSAPTQSSYPTSTPAVTTYPTYPSNPYPSATQAPSGGSGSSGSDSGSGGSGSGDSGSSTRSRGPLWPLWPFGG
jgi:hypothetical protein